MISILDTQSGSMISTCDLFYRKCITAFKSLDWVTCIGKEVSRLNVNIRVIVKIYYMKHNIKLILFFLLL